MSEGWLEVNGARLWFEDSGEGFPVVLLHGGLVHSGAWDELIAVFAGRYRAIRFDARGYGRSLMPTGSFSRVGDALGVMDALRVKRAVLIGLSMGGEAAIDLALEHPDRVAGLVLIGSALSGYDADKSIARSWQSVNTAYEHGDLEEAVEITLHFWTDGTNRAPEQVSPQARARVREMTLQNFLIPEPETPAEERSVVPDAFSRLNEIHQPTLVMVGTNDAPDFLEIADRLSREILGAHKIVFPDAAHHLPLEHPQRFRAFVLEFLDGIV